MSAMKVIDEVRAKGGDITSFKSFCGGLPHQDHDDNPLGYKFSWAPRGVLLASKNTATFTRDGKVMTYSGDDLFDNYEIVNVPGVGELECYPNRNSNDFLGIYGMDPAKTKTFIRGTFRKATWCKQLKKIGECGYLSLEESDLTNTTYLQLLAGLIKSSGTTAAAVKADALVFLKVSADEKVISTMEWLDLFSDRKIGAVPKTPLDAICAVMMEKMAYKDGEQDRIVMRHGFIAEYPDGKIEYLSSTMIDHGIKNGATSMSRTVALPLAMAINLILTGKYTKPGLVTPVIKELYEPLLAELKENGIAWTERVETSDL
jgi:saccharopine dehydrogenase (NADP+, L-glutamate forming)/spermidine synthase